MTFIVYFFVALIAAASVLFGLDFVSAPMSPMPASKYELRAAVPPPPPATVVKVEPRIEPKIEAKPALQPVAAPVVAAKPPAVGAAKPAAVPGVGAPSAIDQQPAAIVAAEPGTVAATQPPAPSCNLEACASAYRSFTAADCTYQPIDGPRRLCIKGALPASTPAAATATPPATAAPEARAQACNIAACSQSYPRSFSAADCTFQPLEGPRRACTK